MPGSLGISRRTCKVLAFTVTNGIWWSPLEHARVTLRDHGRTANIPACFLHSRLQGSEFGACQVHASHALQAYVGFCCVHTSETHPRGAPHFEIQNRKEPVGLSAAIHRADLYLLPVQCSTRGCCWGTPQAGCRFSFWLSLKTTKTQTRSSSREVRTRVPTFCCT